MDDALAARLDGLGEKLDRLIAAVEALPDRFALGGLAASAEPETETEVWRRLGLSEGERRIVSVLFADVSGFTELSERLDAEAFQFQMRETMTLLSECVAQEGGTIEKFIGDAVCAVFGAPSAFPDEPERAVRAALAMHEALERRARERPDLPSLTVHAGVNTGPVIAGAVGDGSQFGVMGDTINTAARLMNLATANETFISATTARRIRKSFEVEDRGSYEVKGKEKAIPAFNVLRELSHEEKTARQEVGAPFIGRERELEVLRELAGATAEGDGCTVLLTGASGAGTSRLAAELASELEADGWRVLRTVTRVHAEAPLGLVATAVLPLLDGRGELTELVRVLLSGGAAAPHDFELGLAEVIIDEAAKAPVAFVLDNADLADPGSLELIRYLSRATGESHVLWLLPGAEVPKAFELLLGSPDVVHLELGPLPESAVADLFGALFPGALSPQQRARLAHLAEGNPEFAAEIGLALVDDGFLVEHADGTWELTGNPDECALPGSVSELVEARIDQLATATRVVIQDASVIGMRFTVALLERTSSIPSAVQTALAESAAAELVRPPAGDDPFWRFRSRLVRDVAYDSILKRARPARHRSVADALVQLEPETLAENADLLAHHYEHSDEPALAIPHLREAALRAERSFSLSGVLDRARRGLRIADRYPSAVAPEDIVAFRRSTGIARLLLGDPGGHEDFAAALEVQRGLGDAAALAALEERMAWYLTLGGRRDDAVGHLQAAQDLAEPRGLHGVLASVATTRAYAAGALGELTVGVAAVDGAAVEAAEAGDLFTECRALLVSGILHYWRGEPKLALENLRRSINLAWGEGFGTAADRCGRWLVTTLVDLGRPDEAVDLAHPLLARADDRGDPTVAVSVRGALAMMDRRRGEYERATQAATLAIDIHRKAGLATEVVADARLALAHVALDLRASGGSGEAEEHFAALEAGMADDPWLAWRIAARIALGRARVADLAGDHDAVIAAANQARAALGRADAHRERMLADLYEGQARAARGEPHGVELLSDARVAAEAIGSPHLIDRTTAALAGATVSRS